MQRIREPAVGGMFYPADGDELRQLVNVLIAGAGQAGRKETVPKALIVPHAGYIYSGPVAATAYARLAPARSVIRRVILLGPSHRVMLSGLALPSADAFATPMGNVPLDADAIERVKKLTQVSVFDDAHAQEHSLEVHLPFLQAVLDHFFLVPLVVGDASAEGVAEVLETLWGGNETLIVISSDLSHYHDYRTASRMDRATSDAFEKLSFEDVGHEHACGCIPVSGLLLAARRGGMHCSTIDLRNSGDTAGSRDSVVGYGAYIIQ